MDLVRFALGVRFEAQGKEKEASFAQTCLNALRRALSPRDMDGLCLYAGADETTEPDKPAFIAVIMGGSLSRTRRIHRKLARALGSMLCRERPFIENNRVAKLSGLVSLDLCQD